MNPDSRKNTLQVKTILLYVLKVLLLAVIYHLAARLGLKMAYVQANTSPVWPPTGIGLAAPLIRSIKAAAGRNMPAAHPYA